jgi:hypothetical protein
MDLAGEGRGARHQVVPDAASSEYAARAMSPRTKARFAQSVLAEIAALSPEIAHAVRARSGDAWQRIEKALPMEWIEEATYNAVIDATRAELGDEAFRALFRRMGRRLIKTPLFQALIEAVIRISGLSPHTLLKAVPRARDAAVAESGTLTYERAGDRCARLFLRDFPPSTFRSGATVLLLSGTWLGLVDIAGHEATAQLDLEDVNLERGRATFVLRW